MVFCDLRGFTSFAETAEPEEIMGTLREYHAAVGAIIHKFEGTIERFAGDGLMAMLNDPVPCADPCGQAVRMADEMRAAVGDLSAKWRKQGFDLGFGVGIAHGYATLGRIGFEGRFDYAAIGSVTNLAARLCSEAKDGQILIDGKVGIAVEAIAELEPLDALTLKGFHRTVKASNVRAVSCLSRTAAWQLEAVCTWSRQRSQAAARPPRLRRPVWFSPYSARKIRFAAAL